MNKNRAEREDKVKGFRSHTVDAKGNPSRSLPEDRRTLREHTFKRFAAWKARVEAAKRQKRMTL